MATDKTAAQKQPTKKAPVRKAPAKKTSAEGGTADSARRSAASAPRASARHKRSGSEIAAQAAQQLVELTGREVEGVTGLSRNDDGWTIEVEVLEVRRIPDTTDVLAIYEITVDEDGELEGYRRVRRYVRGTPSGDQS
jgi:hypothetical protein